MPQQLQAPWLLRSWVLAVVLVLGAVLIVWNVVDHAWLGLAGTALGMFAFIGTRETVRRDPTRHPRD